MEGYQSQGIQKREVVRSTYAITQIFYQVLELKVSRFQL